jgi:hypothetical protein
MGSPVGAGHGRFDDRHIQVTSRHSGRVVDDHVDRDPVVAEGLHVIGGIKTGRLGQLGSQVAHIDPAP